MVDSACDECRAIVRQFWDACAEAGASADQRLKDALMALRNLRGGTEEDLARAEELLPKFSKGRQPEPTKVGQVLLKKYAHEARTGHKVRLLPDAPLK